MRVSCSSSCDPQPPFDDPDLQRIISVYENFGPSIGTGYWENIPDAGSVACTAILLMQVPNDYWDSQHGNTITYLLLIKEVEGVQCDAEIERVGIERTVDLLEGRAFDNTWLENTQ